MTFEQVANWITPADELVTSKALSDLIQRTLTDRSRQIMRYIEVQPQRFFNSLVLAIFEGDPEWLDIRLLDSEFLPDDLSDSQVERVNAKVGLLRLSGNEKVFALDGQHRVEGIKQALKANEDFGGEEISVLFVSHQAGAEGKERTRRLFTTLNRYARAVSKYEKIALDEDDALAIVTRRLLNDHPYLSGARTAYSKSSAIGSSDKSSLTTLPVVYETALTLIKGRSFAEETWSAERIPYPRPTDEAIAALVTEVSQFWTELGEWAPEFKAAANVSDEDRAGMNIRNREGGSSVFRPVLHVVLARALRRWIDRGESIATAFARLGNIPRQLEAPQWRRVIWDEVGGKMIATGNAQSVATDLILHWSGFPDVNPGLLTNYRSLVGDEDAELPGL